MKWTIALLGCASLLLAACGGDSALRGDIARMQSQLTALEAENESLRERIATQQPGASDEALLRDLLARVDRAESSLRQANERINKLQTGGKQAEAEAVTGEETAEKAGDEAYAEFKALQERYNQERDAEREVRRSEQRQQRQAQLEDFGRRAREAGLEFDPSNPRASGMQIWMDPAKREQAMKIAVDMYHEQRLAPLKLTEQQTRDVLRIEAETRQKVAEVTAQARQTGAAPEDIVSQTEQVRKQQEQELQRSMTAEQYEEYKKSAAQGALLPGTVEELGGMLPPGMIPGFGGGPGSGQGG